MTGEAVIETFEARDFCHQFRLIAAPDDAPLLDDPRGATPSLVSRMEADLGTRLKRAAVDHSDTGHPHGHIVFRDNDESSGDDLAISRDYIGTRIGFGSDNRSPIRRTSTNQEYYA